MIPKTLHTIGIGDQGMRPASCVCTWMERNPGWTVKLWTDKDLAAHGGYNASHMKQLAKRELCNLADMMRWGILNSAGGFRADADSVCVRPLDARLLEQEAFACWENAILRPDMIAKGCAAVEVANGFFRQIIKDLLSEPSPVHDRAWQATGLKRLTSTFRRLRYSGLTVLPSHPTSPGPRAFDSTR